MARIGASGRDRIAASVLALASITCAGAVAVPRKPDADRPATAEALFDLRGALLQPALQVTLAPNPKPIASVIIVLPESGAAKIDKAESAAAGFAGWIEPEIRRALMAAGIDVIVGDVRGQVEAVAELKEYKHLSEAEKLIVLGRLGKLEKVDAILVFDELGEIDIDVELTPRVEGKRVTLVPGVARADRRAGCTTSASFPVSHRAFVARGRVVNPPDGRTLADFEAVRPLQGSAPQPIAREREQLVPVRVDDFTIPAGCALFADPVPYDRVERWKQVDRTCEVAEELVRSEIARGTGDRRTYEREVQALVRELATKVFS